MYTKRIAPRAALLAVLGVLATGGAAQAFTPVPIPKPRAAVASSSSTDGSSSAAQANEAILARR
jgi:hypothetical protein